ncbi:MAG: PAS domain-containing protein, partial [Methanobacteriota archaeon]
GYLTLNNKTLVTEANLTAEILLGVDRNTFINHGFGVFITPEHLEMWDLYFKLVLNQREKQTCTLILILKRGGWICLSCTSGWGRDHKQRGSVHRSYRDQ